MIPEIINHSYHRIQDLDLNGLVQRRLRGQITTVSYSLNTLIDSLLPVQEGSSIMLSITEKETMK